MCSGSSLSLRAEFAECAACWSPGHFRPRMVVSRNPVALPAYATEHRITSGRA